jgi:hypothetical protein
MKHRTKDGEEIDIKDMEDVHLKNTIKFIERKAEEGVEVHITVSGMCGDDFYYDVELRKGADALEALNYQTYVDEWNKRWRARSFKGEFNDIDIR